jgi:inhibitor of cysteine peptidase
MIASYTDADNGRTLELKMGDSFDLTLSESRMGGYHWKLADTGEPVLKNEELKATPAHASVPGAGSSRSWRFTAQQPGSAQLRLQHLRSWQPDAPGREFRLDAKVEP